MSVDKNKPTVLVIGDWFIDENWLVAKRNINTSTNIGDIHYLGMHKKLDKRNITLCGASEIIEVLRHYPAFNKFNFIGLGAWNEKDNDILPCTICNKNIVHKHLTPYTIHGIERPDKNHPRKKCLYNINKICSFKKTAKLVNISKELAEISTNRIVRVYEGYSGGYPHLLYRFDWELELNPSQIDKQKIREKLKNEKNIKAVIIEDHGKGVIIPETIQTIIDTLKESKILDTVNWYIRTKKDVEDCEWLENLIRNDARIQLRVADYKYAFRKIGIRRPTFNQELGRSALELLGDLSGDQKFEHGILKSPDKKEHTKKVAILFDNNTAIAKHQNNCFNISTSPGPRQLINIGRTTIFFSALIAQDIHKSSKNGNFGAQCKKALNCAFDWSKQASNAWNEEQLHFYGDYTKALDNLEQKRRASDKDSSMANYTELWKNWNESSELYGYIKEKKGKREEKILQLWRGEGAIKDYICVGGPKRSAINSMLASIAEFNNGKSPNRPFNCLLVSGPGWGKSFLAKSMANHFNMSYMEFSLAQMATANDLIDCFDSICSHQNRTDKKVLIFMDEVNSNIEGNKALSLLLSPIWDGSFIRAGKFYKLRPAVWVFASTEPVAGLSGNDASSKGSDFVSRLNGPIIELDNRENTISGTAIGKYLSQCIDKVCRIISSNPSQYFGRIYDEDEYKNAKELMPPEIRTEQVYLGVSLLNRIWGPISEVEEGVLALFHGLLPMNGIRSMEFYVSKFNNIERGKVRCKNVPLLDRQHAELIRHVIPPKQWYKHLCENNEVCISEMKASVHIETRPKS